MSDAVLSVRFAGRYALYEPIASGGMAQVYLGRLFGPAGFARTVAIKRLHRQFVQDHEFVSMFMDEARLAARVRHPNVLSTLDVVATQGELFLVMEYVHGESLAQILEGAQRRGELVPPRIVVAIMTGVLSGLHAAHEAKSDSGEPLQMVHRDVSPQNVLVGADGHARILDFGVAHAMGRLQTTKRGQVKGKLAYMSPEQLRGKSVTPAADVFAAGVVTWEALTAQRLHAAESPALVAEQVLSGTTPPPSERLPPTTPAPIQKVIRALDPIVLRGVARPLEARYTTALEMAQALEAAILPATANQVAAWLQEFCAPVLAKRADILARVERTTARQATSAEVIDALSLSDSTGMAIMGSHAEASSTQRSPAEPLRIMRKPEAPGVPALGETTEVDASLHEEMIETTAMPRARPVGRSDSVPPATPTLGVPTGAPSNRAAGRATAPSTSTLRSTPPPRELAALGAAGAVSMVDAESRDASGTELLERVRRKRRRGRVVIALVALVLLLGVALGTFLAVRRAPPLRTAPATQG